MPASENPRSLCILRSAWLQVIAHCRRELPREACGILAGRGRTALRAIALPNASGTPEREYLADPESLYAALCEVEERGEQMLAIYHSHPQGPPNLSSRDLEQAFWPQALQVVVSLAGRRPVVRAFHVEGCGLAARASPVNIRICKDTG